MNVFDQCLPAVMAAAGLVDEVVVWTPMEGLAEYRGTRAAIEAEGVVPADIQWPKEYDLVRWESGPLRFLLQRHRPEGVKGSRRQLATVDWWHLRWEYQSYEQSNLLSLKRKEQRLRRDLYLCSNEGRREISEHVSRYLKAIDDEKYRSFKSRIPALAKRKRRHRSETDS